MTITTSGKIENTRVVRVAFKKNSRTMAFASPAWKTRRGAERWRASFGSEFADKIVTFTHPDPPQRRAFDAPPRGWVVYVDGEALRDKAGRPRRFLALSTAESAVLATLSAALPPFRIAGLAQRTEEG